MASPKISVIIPIYNTGRYLPECVESVRKQTLQDIEIILVDDESPDNAPQLCDEYARQDERVKVVHKKNGGLGFARNSGLDVAIGEYVSFIDSDDFISSNMMQTLYEVAKQYDADDVRSGTIFYNNGKKTFRHDVNQTKVYRGSEEVKSFVFDLLGPLPEESRDVKYMMSVCLALHKRSVIEENCVRFTSERKTLSEDLIFDLDLFPKMNCIVCIPDCFYHYRMTPNSLTHTFSMEKYHKNASFFAAVEDRLQKNYDTEEYSLHFQRLKFLYLRTSIGNISNTTDSIIDIKNNICFVLNDDIWNDLIAKYPSRRMDFKRVCYFWLIKNKMAICLWFVSRKKIWNLFSFKIL